MRAQPGRRERCRCFCGRFVEWPAFDARDAPCGVGAGEQAGGSHRRAATTRGLAHCKALNGGIIVRVGRLLGWRTHAEADARHSIGYCMWTRSSVVASQQKYGRIAVRVYFKRHIRLPPVTIYACARLHADKPATFLRPASIPCLLPWYVDLHKIR